MPSGIALGTHADNVADMAQKGRHGRCKLTLDEVAAIRVRLACGERHPQIAADFGVSDDTVSRIARRKSWRIA